GSGARTAIDALATSVAGVVDGGGGRTGVGEGGGGRAGVVATDAEGCDGASRGFDVAAGGASGRRSEAASPGRKLASQGARMTAADSARSAQDEVNGRRRRDGGAAGSSSVSARRSSMISIPPSTESRARSARPEAASPAALVAGNSAATRSATAPAVGHRV